VGTIEKAGVGQAGSGKKKNEDGAGRHPPLFFLTDPARPALAFSIVPTD